MNILTTLFLIIVFFSTAIVEPGTIEINEDQDRGPNVTSPSNSSDTEKYSEDKLKELRIEMVKLQILSKLNLKEPPPTAAVPLSESSKETIEILLNEEEQRWRFYSIDREERLVIHARNNGVNCSNSDEIYCRKFQFEMSVDLNNTSSIDLWIYSIDESSEEILSLSIFYSNGEEESFHHRVFHDLQKSGWNKIQLPSISLFESWNGSFFYSLEVSGVKIEDYGDRSLFLMVTKSSFAASRQRRDLTCDSSQSCCLRPLRVSLSEIGFNWVLYPVHLDVNMCTGKCMMDHSKMKTHYERAMTEILEKDSSLIESLGVCWTLCCKPKEMESVRVIYNDTDGIIHDQYIPELTVKSCSCS